jgi:predicted TPR repeat methyltransferase
MTDIFTEEQQTHEDTPGELTLDDALALAIELHRKGEIDTADVLYERILEIAPEHSDALHYRGLIALYRGKKEAALELVTRSIALGPANADRCSNLGNVLIAAGRIDEAVEAYRNAIALAPEHANAYMNLGVILGALKRYEEAAKAHQRAIELNPASAAAYCNFGNMLLRQGKLHEAIPYYCRSFTLEPQNSAARTALAFAYIALGEREQAVKIYEQWLADEPGAPEPTHLLAACLGRNVPARAPDAYIEKAFDNFARTFDQKLQQLEYRAPQLVADALARSVESPCKALCVLDAGCGTGLCGSLLAPYSSRLIGVDLSTGMLDEARKRGVYDELFKEELTSFIARHAQAFDAMVSADTLCYFGALEAVFEAAFAALRRGGVFILTLEETVCADRDYVLTPHGRYAHTARYVERILRDCGFTQLALERAVLRFELRAPVNGLVVTAAKLDEAAQSAFAQHQPR